MLFLLPLLLQVEILSDQLPTPVEIDPRHVRLWLDYTNCLSNELKGQTNAVEVGSAAMAVISNQCRDSVIAKMNAGVYKGISKNEQHSSRKNVYKMFDGADVQLATSFSRFPDVAKVNARVEEMGLGVTVYDPIAHLYDRYTECLAKEYNDGSVLRLKPSDRVAGWKKSIKTCENLKITLKAEADPIMARQPDFQNPEVRKSAIAATFDGHDKMILKAASTNWSKSN